ncbi:MAG: tetratricopeptide repeat protein [Pyrinomonadaceae bacterium]
MKQLAFRLFTASIFSVFVICPAFAQLGQSGGSSSGHQLHGQVRYVEGGGPAFQILVRLERFDGGTVDQQYTDRTGKFRFSGLRPLTYIVSIHTPGFNDIQQQIELVTKTSDYVLLSLKPDGSSRAASLGPAVILDAKVPLDARKEFEKGRVALLENGKSEEGIARLERAVAIYPSFLEAYLLLGTAYMDAHQLAKAEATLRQAMAINSKRPEAYIALGEVYRQQKKYAEAEKTLRDGLKLDNRLWQGHYTLGRVYWEISDIVKAGPQIGLSIQLKPDLADAHLLAGNILLRAHKPDDALLEFEEYLRLAPKGEYSGQAQELVKKIKRALATRKR